MRRLRKRTNSDVEDVTGCGRLFLTRAAATGKALSRSRIVDNRVRQSATVKGRYGGNEWPANPLAFDTCLCLTKRGPIISVESIFLAIIRTVGERGDGLK